MPAKITPAPTKPPVAEAKAQSISGTAAFNKKFGDGAFNLGAKANTALSYSSSNNNVASVDAKGNVTIKGAGSAKITITAAATGTWKKAVKTVTINVSKAAPVIKVKATKKTLKVKKLKKKAQTIAAGVSVNSRGKLTFKKVSGKKNITVNKKTGKITVKKGTKKGTYKVKVKVSAAAAGSYNAGSKTVTYTIKVK